MSVFHTLKAKKRDQTGKGVARRLRASGVVPAIFYNVKGANIPVQVNEKELERLFQTIGRTTVFNIEIEDGGIHPALFWDIDFYPIKNRIQHVDIFGLDLDKEIRLRVPLIFTGVAKGTKVGGKLEVYREFVAIACKPLSLPSKIEIDVTDMDMNTSLRIADLKLPEGVHAEYANNFVIVSVGLGRSEEEGSEEGEKAAE